MFGLFGGLNTTQINEAFLVHSINYATLVIILTEKGIISPEEMDAARSKATHIVDQIVAEKQAEVDREFEEKHPGVRKLFAQITGNSSE